MYYYTKMVIRAVRRTWISISRSVPSAGMKSTLKKEPSMIPKWTYKGKEFGLEDVGDYYGFIYRVTNLVTGHDYVGRKYFKSKRKLKPLIGRVNKRIKVVDTDWQDYWGSSKRLCADIEEIGHGNFKREIIMLCETRGNTNYYEAKIQFDEDVLLREDNYNGIIAIKIGIGSVKNIIE